MDQLDLSGGLDQGNIKQNDLLGVGAPNYYEVLDLDSSATRLEIREAFLRLKSAYNSSNSALYSLMSEDEARENMVKIEEAFRILGDDVKRREYDDRAGYNRATTGRATHPAIGNLAVENVPNWSGGHEHVGMSVQARAQEEANARQSKRALTLPVIKVKANNVSTEQMQAQFNEIVASGDIADGDLYRRLRDVAAVSIEEMQERTKVSIGYLKAIESNRFERLPQAVYVKGFLRSYFRYLLIPEAEKLVNAFGAKLQGWQEANRKH